GFQVCDSHGELCVLKFFGAVSHQAARSAHHFSGNRPRSSECFYNRVGGDTAMPQFIIQLFKTHPEYPRPFSNTYRTNATDLTTAGDVADAIEEEELAIFDSATTFTYARVSTATPGDDVFLNRLYNHSGASGVTSPGEPLFNTCRIDFNVSGSGRPSRFHYRNIHEVEHTGRALETAFITIMNDFAIALLDAVAGAGGELVQEDGDVLLNGTCFPLVVQRSKSRRRRKP